MPPKNYNSESEAYYNKEQAVVLEQMIAQAVEAAARGENVDQLLDLLLVSVAGPQKEEVKKKFAAALKKKNLKQPKGEADIPSRGTLARLREALAISAQQAYERVLALVKSRPDIAEQIKQAGQMLAQNGVAVERIQIVTEADLGTIAPSSGVGKPQTRGTERGA